MFPRLAVIRAALPAAIMALSPVVCGETLTYSSYYPAPYGGYKHIIATNSAFLATSTGNVGIRTGQPAQKLDVNGKIRTLQTADSDPDDTAITKGYFDSTRSANSYYVKYSNPAKPAYALQKFHDACTSYAAADSLVCVAACHRFCVDGCAKWPSISNCAGGISGLNWTGGTRTSADAAGATCLCWAGT